MKKLLCLILIVLFVPAGMAYGKMFNNPGMELSIAGLSHKAYGAEDPDYDFSWASVGLFDKRHINDSWSLNICGNISYLKWDHKHDKVNHDTDHSSVLLDAKVILYRKITKRLSFGAGGGLGVMSQRSNLPEVGNCALYGIATARANLKINDRYSVELAEDHLSGLLYDDPGKNVLSFKVLRTSGVTTEEPDQFYAGLGYFLGCADYASNEVGIFDDIRPYGGVVRLGTHLTPVVALELRYMDVFGKESASDGDGGKTDFDIQAILGLAKIDLPKTGKAQLYGLLGWANVRLEAPDISEKHSGVSYGFGAEVDVTKSLFIGAEYNHIVNSESCDISGFTVLFNRRF